MIRNSEGLLRLAPIKHMLDHKSRSHGVSHGLTEAGYDITLADNVTLASHGFALASATEYFQMPDCLLGIVHDKSTWARQGLSVFNTVIEPSWTGYLTLELVNHSDVTLDLPAGAGIAQVLFHDIQVPAVYAGKYQNQESGPQVARFE